MTTLYVSEPGSKLKKDDQRVVVLKGDDVLDEIPLLKLDQVVLMGRSVSITTPLMFELLNRGVDVVYLSRTGRFISRLENEKHNNVKLRYHQILRANDPAFALKVAKQIVKGKVINQAAVIRRHARGMIRPIETLGSMKNSVLRIADKTDADSLRGLEGYAARNYFDSLRKIFSPPFDGRSWGFDRREYYPAPDPVNSMLSFGYTLLLRGVHSSCHRVGLDPYVGFFHTLNFGKPSLALDLMEEFRPVLIDTLILKLINQHMVNLSDFEVIPANEHRKQSCKMNEKARRKLIEGYEKRMNETAVSPLNHKRSNFRQILLQQVRLLANVIEGKEDLYRAYEIH